MTGFRERLHAAIPGGAHTYSRGDDQFPATAPEILERGEGAYVWAPDGRKFLDYGMALRAVTLGYANERVNRAAFAQMQRGVNLTRASVTELEAAELLIDIIGSAEMVKFGKNGSNVTTGAAKIARAYTGRRYICIPRQHPFFSFDDWFIGTTPLTRGVPAVHYSSTLVFDYGDLQSLRRLFDEHPDQIAGVMLEPATTLGPCTKDCPQPARAQSRCGACGCREGNFLHQVQALCRAKGALFILDEMITGFRWHLGGAQAYYGVEPDLSTFGKAMANGFSVAAVTGRREFMEVGAINRPGMERTFLMSTTHGAEMAGLGAFKETVAIYRENSVTDHLWRYGEELFMGINKISQARGLADHVRMEGSFISMNYATLDAERRPSMAFRTLFAQELARHGVLMPWVAVSTAHGATELDLTLTAVDAALAVYQRALEGGVERFLEGPAVRPVFRRFN